jgi:hypothetical protein
MKVITMLKANTIRLALALLLLATAVPVIKGATSAAAFSNFVYVVTSASGGDHYGDDPNGLGGVYRGDDFTYTFNLPGVDQTKSAQVIASTFNVGSSCNRFEINGVQIGGVLRDHNDASVWETETARIPSGLLKATGNTLTIRALNSSCGSGGDLDDFMVANVTVHYAQQ